MTQFSLFASLFLSFVKFFRVVLAFFIIIFYMPQTYRFNPVIRQLHAWNWFLTYTDARIFVRRVNPICMFLFLAISVFLGCQK